MTHRVVPRVKNIKARNYRDHTATRIQQSQRNVLVRPVADVPARSRHRTVNHDDRAVKRLHVNRAASSDVRALSDAIVGLNPNATLRCDVCIQHNICHVSAIVGVQQHISESGRHAARDIRCVQRAFVDRN